MLFLFIAKLKMHTSDGEYLSTSGLTNNSLASLYCQFSGTGYFFVSIFCNIVSIFLYCWINATARFGPIPWMDSQ